MPQTAFAAVDQATMTCPVDGEEVEVTILLSTNAFLGHDRDLCPHASGEDDEIRNAVSSCPKCGFAGTAPEFRAGVREEITKKVSAELKPVSTPWERYASRAKILEWSGAPAERIGESWLRAAWSVRLDPRPIADTTLGAAAQRVTGALMPEKQGAPGKDAIMDLARDVDAAAAGKGSKKIAKEDLPAAHYLSGALHRQRGELDAAEERFARALALAASSPLAAPLQDAIARDRESIELERGYLTRALSYFRAALVDGEKVAEEKRSLLAYLAAESARRVRNWDEAERWYKVAEKLASKPPQEGAPPGGTIAREMVQKGLADVRAGKSAAAAKKKTK